MKNFTQAFFTTKSKSIKWVFAILTVFLLNSQQSFGQRYWRIDGTSAILTSSSWSTTGIAPFTSAWANSSNIIFQANSAITNVTNTPVGNLTINPGFTVTWTSAGTFSTGAGIRTFDIGAGSTLTWNGQGVATAAGTGFIKSGSGIWNIGTQGGAYPGGFTMNAGTVSMTGNNGLGTGALTINGGAITTGSSAARTPGVTGSITVGGNFQLGDAANVSAGTGNLTFSNAVALGASTRTITIGGAASYTLSGIISGSAGSGLTVAAVPTTGTGTLVLSGINTYTGDTTISSGNLSLSGSGAIASSPVITVGSGANFSIAGRSAALTLAAGQSLRSSATGSNTTATVTVAATPTLTLSAGGLAFTAYDGGATAPMTVAGTGGSLALNSSPVTVTTTTALTAGTYTLIAKSGSATVTGTPGTLTMAGSGLAASTSGALSVVSGELILTVTASGPTVTLAQLSAGIAPSPLVASTTDKAILGFSATSSAGTPSMTAFNIGTSSTSVSKFTNIKLYTSTDNSYATAGDNTQITGFTFAQTATQLQFSALTEALSTSAKYYFIVADIDATVTAGTTAVQPSLTNANVTVATATITGGTITGTNYAFAVPSGTPTISPSGTLAAVNTTYGTASASPTSFTVSGSDLTDDIVITPPAGFEISKTAIGSGYAATQTLTQSVGTVALTTIYVRLANTTAFGTYSGNITLVSTLDGLSVNVATVSSTVAKKALTVSGLSLVAASKVYDATTTTAITGTAALQAATTLALNTSGDGKPIDTDTVSLTGTAVGNYNTKDVATATTVSYSGLSLTGASAANYSLTAHATSAATITAKPITLSGLTIPASKVYNGTTAAVVTGSPGTLATAIVPGTGTAVDGIRYTGDTANLTGTAVGTYNNANVVSATTVVFTGVSLTGAQAGNYSLTAHPSQAATITKATAVITFGAIAAKTTADVPFALTATSTSGNTVTYISGTTATATIAVSTVTIVAAGTTLITASDAGNANYDAAADVSQTLTVTNGPIWSNTITGTTTSSSSNPYTTGDAPVSNLIVSGIGRGSGVTAATAGDRYACSGWNSVALDANDYFEFTLTPAPGYEIDFTNFIYTGEASGSGATAVAFRSSLDGFVGNIGTPAINGTTISLSGASYQNITSAITFRYYGWGASASGGTFSVNGFQFNGAVVLGTPVPEMNVTQSGSIASGGTNAFGNQENGTSGSAVTFTIQNTGNAVLNLSGSPKVAITGNTADFVINEVATTATVAATSGTTTFTVTFSPQAVGARAAQLSIANDDSNENPYLINLTGTGTTSQNSSISAATFTAPTNIAYGSYQAGNITSVNSLEVGKFTLQDGVSDNDSFGTTLSTITFSLSNFANVQRVALYDGSTELQEIAAGATNTFNAGLGAITTASGGTKDFSIRVTFNGTVTDNQQFQFTVTGATADVAGSGFAAANAGGANTSIAGDNNRIEVTANRLTFGTVTGSSINVSLSSFTLSATDGLLNVDLDRSAAVTLGSTSAFPSGNFTRTTPTYALTGGSITISNVAFADGQTGINLTADAPGLTQGVSDLFDILLVTFPANSYRSTGAGNWATTATWERFVSNVWGASAAPSTSTTNTVYILHAISSNGSITPSTIVIENGGTLTYTGASSCATSMLVENGGTLQINAALNFTGATVTVESGGAFNVNYSTATGATSLWAGTEDFQAGSTVDIQNWSYGSGTGFRLIQNPSSITANTDGYYFGNLTISGAPSSLFVVADGSQTINLCKNNFTVSESGTNNVAITNAVTNATIGGNIIVTNGQLSVASTSSGNPITTVLGNISVPSGGTLNLNQSSSGSATSIVQLKGNLSVVSGGTLNSTDAGCAVVFSGTTATQTVSIAGTLGTNAGFEVGDGTNATTVQLIGQDFSLTNASNAFTVKANSILDFNYFNISGIGNFTLDGTGELRITAAAGLNATGTNTGNVINTGTRSIAQTGYFRYTGNVTPQATGNAMTSGSTAKRIIIDKTNPTDVVNLTQSTATTGQLQIIEGTFVETFAANITGSGDLVMSGGTYRTPVLATTLPQISGTYTLTGGTIDLNGAGGQVLRGARAYANLTFSTSGTKTLSSAPSSITGTATVQSGVILDVANRTFGGPGTNLTMTGTSRYITQGTGTKPDAEGTYSLGSGTTIEFANSVATPQVIRLGLSPISYANVEVTGTSVSSNSITDGIFFQAGGSFTVKQGASFTLSQPGGLNGLVNSAVRSTNSPTVTIENAPSLSTIVYNGVGQTLTGRADYGNLTINNTSGALTTSGDVTVSGTLTLTNGIVTTGANTIAVTNDTTPISGGSATAYVSGKLRLTYPATGTDVARTFPIGKGGAYRPLVFSYDTAPASRTVLVEQFEAAFPTALPSTAALSGNRYWNVTQSSTGASYKVTLNSGPSSITGAVVIIRREGAGASTSNDVTTPNYTNATSFSTTDISNDVALGTCVVCTQIRPMQCGNTLRWIDEKIQASPRSGATQYRFEVIRTDNALDSRTITINTYLFNPATQLLGGLIYGKSYFIRVKTFIGATENPYGNTCIVTAPSEPLVTTTKVRPFQCGATLLYMTQPVEATPVYLATTYEFEVTSVAGTFVATSANYTFSLYYSVPGRALYGTAYSIRVRSKGAATAFTAWGDPCVVTTPIARMSDASNNDIFNVKAFPNPFASHFNLDIESSSDAKLELKVYDMIGRQLEVRKASVSELNVLEVGRNYPAGVYNLVVSQGDKVKSIRMIKR